MCLGPLLLTPQPVRRAAALPSDLAFVDELVALVGRLASDPARGEAVMGEMRAELEALGERLFAAAEDGLGSAEARLRALWADWLDAFEAFAAAPPSLETVDDALATLEGGVAGAVERLEGLSPGGIRAGMAELLDLVETDLRLTPEPFLNELRLAVGAIVVRLEAPRPGADRELMALLASAAALIRRLGRALEEVEIPALNADVLAGHVLELLERIGFDLLVERARCLASTARTVLGGATALVELAPTGGFGPGTVGAASPPAFGDSYGWYASWLLQDKTRPFHFSLFDWLPGFPADEVAVTADGTEVVHRKVLREDEALALAAGAPPHPWHRAKLFGDPGTEPRYTFGEKLDAEFLEEWARWSAAGVDWTKSVWHLAAAGSDRNNEASHIPHFAYNFLHGIFKAEVSPFGSWLTAGTGLSDQGAGVPHWIVRWLFDTTVPLGITLGASFQGRHTEADEDAFAMWVILLADDVFANLTIDAVPNALRELSLEIFTLLNNEGPLSPPAGEDNRPLNRRHLDAIVGLFVLFFTWLTVKLFPRDRYTYPTDGRVDNLVTESWILWGVVVNALFTAIGTFIGTMVGFLLSRSHTPGILGKQLGRNIVRNVLTFWLNVYLFAEGDTGGGEYNPRGDAFDGYPDPKTSPYTLPYASSDPILCDQGNQGMWSHNDMAGTAQVYAYDFALDQDVPILAARDGTVVDWFDWVPNDQDVNTPSALSDPPPTPTDPGLAPGQTSSESWNFVLLRHDDPFGEEAAAQDVERADHDRGPGGDAMVTYGVYGHGRTGSVQELLQPCTPGGLPQEIVGLRIHKGQPIMRSGNTGNSFHNHLHMDVRAHATQPDPMVAAPDAVPLADLDDFTIPFVFREVTHLIAPDGVCQALTWYRSENTSRPC